LNLLNQIQFSNQIIQNPFSIPKFILATKPAHPTR
jgi:hypothetical protein